jgi:hypothetical protein
VMIEPSHPFQGRQFHRLLGLPRPAAVNDLGLVQPVDGLGQCVDAPMSRGRSLVPQISKD